MYRRKPEENNKIYSIVMKPTKTDSHWDIFWTL